MNTYFIVVFAIYLVLVLILLVGWFMALQPNAKTTKDKRFITVIVPFRNESNTINKLLQSLVQQSYPFDLFEVICVNDHSTDDSVLVIENFSQKHANIRLMHLPADLVGKKQAITLGVNHSIGEIMVTTDADCIVSTGWLEKINERFSEKVQLLIGAVKIEITSSFFSKLQATEFASLIGSGFATAAFQIPTMANGANLAFRKQAFQQVNGYKGTFEIASGDDEHLMRKIEKAFPNSIAWLADAEAIVVTQPQPTLRDFFNQRLRWASKWRFNQSLSTKLLAVFILVFQVTWLTLIIFFAIGKTNQQLSLTLIISKIFLEFIFLYAIQLFLKIRWSWLPFFFLQFIYPIYVVVVAVKSNVARNSWKDRTV
jgi:poly-beta-1,6-N-acetyl-D-glucosamine synthase